MFEMNLAEKQFQEQIKAAEQHLETERNVLVTQCQRRDSAQEKEYYMCTFDADEEFDEAASFLTRFGFVCLRNMVSDEKRLRLESKINAWLESLQTGLNCNDFSTFVNSKMPDNFSNGVLDGIVPPSFAETREKSAKKTELVNDANLPHFRCGKSSQSVMNREHGKEVHALVNNNPEMTERFLTEMPIYSVAREAPGNDDEINTELQTVAEMRYRFDTLSNSQEAWNIRTDPKIYRFFRRILQAGDDLLVSIDRFAYQRPIQSRPRGSTEDWKNNYEHRPVWEHNPFWKGDPLLITKNLSEAESTSMRAQKTYNKVCDGSLFMAQSHRKQQGSKKRKLVEEDYADKPCLPFFSGYQGILAVCDMPIDGGAVNLVAGFHIVYKDYAMAHVEEWSNTTENIIHAQKGDEMAERLVLKNAVSIAMRAGTMLIYDKRLPRWGSPNRRVAKPTVAMFISMWPREPIYDAAYRRIRALSVRYGIRCTALRHLTGHSATAPRWKREFATEIYNSYNMPLFTELGLCLLGVRNFTTALVQKSLKVE